MRILAHEETGIIIFDNCRLLDDYCQDNLIFSCIVEFVTRYRIVYAEE